MPLKVAAAIIPHLKEWAFPQLIVTVSDFTGRVLKRLDGSVGDHTIPMPAGQYVVTVGAETFKIVL